MKTGFVRGKPLINSIYNTGSSMPGYINLPFNGYADFNVRYVEQYLLNIMGISKNSGNTPKLSFPSCIKYGINSNGNLLESERWIGRSGREMPSNE
jgi:hypothetical protein